MVASKRAWFDLYLSLYSFILFFYSKYIKLRGLLEITYKVLSPLTSDYMPHTTLSNYPPLLYTGNPYACKSPK